MINPMIEVMSTWRNHATSELFHRSLMILGLSSIPTMKSKKLIPILENDWKAVLPCSNDGKKILMSVPAMMYQMIIGCLKSFIIPILRRTTPMMTLSEIKICSDIGRD
jgi:hypothetical protein